MTALTDSSSVMGMIRLRECLAKRLGAGLAIWTLAVGVSIPFLDRDLLGSDIAIEAEHQAACSLPVHDHTICSHYGKLPWATRPAQVERALPPSLVEAAAPTLDVTPQSRLARPTNPRAPPTL